MDDRALLEAAARAAGIGGGWDWPRGAKNPIYWRDANGKAWQPLHDDGDALRLAVKLRMIVAVREEGKTDATVRAIDGVVPWLSFLEDHGDDSMAATRRAIVRAAAAIGRAS